MANYAEIRYKSIEDNTYLSKERMWFESFAENLQAIKEGRNVQELMGRCKGPCIVVGAGPSVEKFGQLSLLKNRAAHVVATDRMLLPLMKNLIRPELSITVDGAPLIAEFYDSPLAGAVDAVLPVNVHPSVARLVNGSIYWFVPELDQGFQKSERSVTRAMYWMSGRKVVGQAYGNSGGFAWSLAELLGHDPVILVGIDFSYGPALAPSQTTYWKGFLEKREGKAADAIRLDYRYETNPFGHRVLTDVVWDGYRDIFMKGLEKSKITTVNCSSYTTIHGHGITTMNLEQAIKEFGL